MSSVFSNMSPCATSVLEIIRRVRGYRFLIGDIAEYKLVCSSYLLLYAKKIGFLSQVNCNFEFPKEAFTNELFCSLYEVSAFCNLSKSKKEDFFPYCYEIVEKLNRISNSEFLAHYAEIIDVVLYEYSSSCCIEYKSCEFAQPKNISDLVIALAERMQPRKVYNPFAGLCSYALIPGITGYYGQELDKITFLLAQVRLDANGKDIHTIHWEDSFDVNTLGDDMDFMVATPPFGMRVDLGRLNDRRTWEHRNYKSAEDYILHNLLDSPSLEKGIIVLPSNVCFDKKHQDLRKAFIERNALEMVVELPAGIFYTTSIRTVVLVIDKFRRSDKVLLVDAKSCLTNPEIKSNVNKDIDIAALLNLIDIREPNYVATVSADSIRENNFSWFAEDYRFVCDDLSDDKVLISLSDVLTVGEKIDIEDGKAVVIKSDDFSSDVNGLFETKEHALVDISQDDAVKGYRGEHLVVTLLSRNISLCKCSFDEPFFLKDNPWNNQIAFAFKKNPFVSIDYLFYALLNSAAFMQLNKRLNRGSLARITRDFVNLILECKIAVHKSPVVQAEIVSGLREEYIQQREAEMKAEMERLGIRTASSDLSHMLGTSFDKVANLIEDLRSGDLLQEEREAALFSLNDNFQYMKRFISSVGADFSLAKLKPVEVGVNEFINSYLKSWGNFGKNAFSLKYIPGVLDDTTFVVDETLFRILFDTLLDNAYRHGFNKLESPTNRVAISTSCVSMHDREYVLIEVANNGVPFPEGFSLKKFISRGTFVGSSGRTGLGGNHIYAITKKHKGYLAISNSTAWNVIFEILIPVELYSETENIVAYGNTDICL